MKRLFLFLIPCSLVLFLASCGNSGRMLPSASGSIYECLVVAPATPLTQAQRDAIAACHFDQTGGGYDSEINSVQDLLAAVLGEPTPCLPQMEPYFKLTKVTPQTFDDFLKPTRNIVLVDINPERYTGVRAKSLVDQWSHPQAVVRIQTPCVDSLIGWWMEHGPSVREWLVREELRRAKAYLNVGHNDKAVAAVEKTIGVKIAVPSDYELIMDTTDLVWCCNNKGPMRKDLVLYRTPYTDPHSFTPDYLNARRDSVLGRYITASVPGSYMGTEYKVIPPVMNPLAPLSPTLSNSFYGVEIRGLWKIKNGEAMGGPYVSHTRIDEMAHTLVTAEVFIYAGGQKKRNALRQAEAILYTLTLPQEQNQLQEVVVGEK